MILLAWLLFGFACLRLAVSVVNLVSRPYLPRGGSQGAAHPEVSVLIPARNEERRIGGLLADLAKDRSVIREILVYDDQSTDATARIVGEVARKEPAVRLLAGGPLPEGWLGKNHACHRMAAEAAGSYLLFLDADVDLRPRTVMRALRYAQRTRVEFLSVFPKQRMPEWGARLAVPLMNWILLSLLPLMAVRKSPRASLCAANGQFLLFEAATYRTLQPHRMFRSAAVEDMRIAQEYKRRGLRVDVLLGRDDVACTMYGNLRDAVAGFSKNVFSFFGGREWLCYLFAAATTAGPFVAFAALGAAWGVAYVAVAVAIRFATSAASCQPAAWNVVMMVPQQAVLWRIIVAASVRRRRRRLLWKGRNIFSQAER